MGVVSALEVPDEMLNERQKWVKRITQMGKAELSIKAANELNKLGWPRYYLDFETIALAVPRWAQTRPYSTQVPFQWSCHIEQKSGSLSHDMFLHVNGEDPRRTCAESLINILGCEGPIFVYFQAFEKSRIKELAQLFTDLASQLLAINERIVDLLPLAQNYYYHPDMKGSWSIKAVLPTISPDLCYDELTVGNGMAAQEAYKEIVHPSTPEQRKHELIQGLREYCTLDTLAMVRLAWFFQQKRLKE